jgi:hypothetical protein
MVTCPSCKSPVEVPDDFEDEKIRCGICWSLVDVGFRDLQPVAVGVVVEDVKLEERPDPFEHMEGRPAIGMGPVEDLLRNVSERMPHMFTAPKIKASQRIQMSEAERAKKPIAPRMEEEGLRRKRGVQSSFAMPMEPEEEKKPSMMPLIMVVVMMVMCAAAFLVFRYVL